LSRAGTPTPGKTAPELAMQKKNGGLSRAGATAPGKSVPELAMQQM